MIKVRAGSIVVASGAFEQPAVFRNNDLPGVMLASAAQRLIYRYAVQPMQRAVVLSANAEGYAAALDLLDAGVEVAGRRRSAHRGSTSRPLRRKFAAVAFRSCRASCVYEAMPAAGLHGRRGCDGVPASARRAARMSRRVTDFACDGVVMSVGFAPANALLHQAGARMRFDERTQQFVPDTLPAGVFAAGRVNGVYDLANRLQRRRARSVPGAAASGAASWLAPSRRCPPRRVARPTPIRSSSIRRQELRRLRRGPAAQRLRPRGAGRLRQHRAAEALHDGRHGAVAGQALEHERSAHPGADPAPADRRSRHHHRAAVLSSGAAEPSGRPRIHTRAPHAAALAATSAPARCSCRPACGCVPSTTRATGKSKSGAGSARRCSPCAARSG